MTHPTDDGPAAPAPQTTVTIVPHTHWDREWHQPFQVVRSRLVGLVDEVLAALESGRLAHFLLDGQTSPVDDHLAVRPADEPRIRALVAAGRLAVGPWATLPDEFLVSGETLVRSLERGLARSAELAADPTVGYLPDSFGHCAQMPQLLALAGLDHAVVWRGVPRAVDRTAFLWEAPDGSTVRTEWLVGSYANARTITADPADLVATAASYAEELGPMAVGDLLLMHGGDHRRPFPGLADVVAAANAAQARWRFVVRPLAEHVAAQPTQGLPRWRGELRSGATTDVLAGVASNRVDVHRAKAGAERALERVAEPLAALHLPGARHPTTLLELAWDALVTNSAHDSACACSADAVVDAVLVRHAEATQIAEAVTGDALAALAATIDAPAGSVVVANPTPVPRAGVVEVEVVTAADGTHVVPVAAPDGEALLWQAVGEPFEPDGFVHVAAGRKLRWIVDLLDDGPGGFMGDAVAEASWGPGTTVGVDHGLVLRLAAPGEAPLDVAAARARLLELAESGATVSVRTHPPLRRRLAVLTPPVPGFGWTTVHWAHPGHRADHAHAGTTADGDGVVSLRNDLLTVVVDPDDGTLALRTGDGVELAGLHRLVDGGDGGDTYTWSPPGHDRLVDGADAVSVVVTERGPARARAVVTATYTWPAAAVGDHRRCTARTEATVTTVVRTTVELVAGEPFVRVRTEWDDRAHDHRLRAHHRLPATVTGSTAECAFAVVHRGLTAEGGAHELATPTWPSRRFVDVSWDVAGLTVVHDGLHEHEVVAGGRELAVTLLRAVGWLSRLEPDRRPKPAGPSLATPAAQLDGPRIASCALAAHAGPFDPAAGHALADAALVPLRTHTVATTVRTQPPEGRALAVGGGVAVSAVRRRGDELVVRVHHPASGPGVPPLRATVAVAGTPAAGRVVDLRGRELVRFDASGVDVPPGAILTLVVPTPTP